MKTDAKELRIGNYVNLIAEGHENEPDLICWDIEDYEYYKEKMQYIEPIEVNENELLKFSFENGVDEMTFCNNTCCIYWRKFEGHFEINGEKYFKKSIHKLQNLIYEMFEYELERTA